MKKITKEEVLQMARLIQKEMPNNRNPRVGGQCLYTGPDGSHCFVGEIFARFGTPIPDFIDVNNSVPIFHLPPSFVLDYEYSAILLLRSLQCKADLGPKWGDIFI